MNTASVSLGYVILYVNDVAASLSFYEKAFGLKRRFFHEDGGKAYGELETGTARMAFASLALANEHLRQEVVAAGPDKPPLGVEVALVTSNVPELFAQAVNAGACAITKPETKPWGQTVAYVRDNNGFLVELCTPMG
jgi:uncharacterized glyoxalase superfamily protein PhnB